jgi:DNA-binding MarR family transcriptional regulator
MADFETSLNDLLVDTFYSILKYESAALSKIAGVSVSINEAHMIEFIASCGEQATISLITAQMQLAMPTVTVAVQRLQRKGFVTKVPCQEDGRRSYIRLTEQGERINRAHSIFHRRMVRDVSGQFGAPEKDVLLQAIQRLSDFFKDQTKAVE